MRIDGRELNSPGQDFIGIPSETREIAVALMLPLSVRAFTVRVPMALNGAGGSIEQLR
jgi:hypothetical protein